MRGNNCGVLCRLVIRLCTCISAGPLSLCRRFYELRAERTHLLACSTTHVERRDNGAESTRGCDRLQPCNARAHDERLRRRNRACSGGEHGEELVERGGTDQRRLISGDAALRREDVHGLRAGDARHKLKRECGDLGARERWEDLFVGARGEEGNERAALREGGDFVCAWLSHLHHHVRRSGGERCDIRDQGHPRLLIRGIQEACRATRAALEDDLMSRSDKLGGCVRDERHAALARESFAENPDLHSGNPIAPSDLGRKVRPIRRTPHRCVHQFCDAVFRNGWRPPTLDSRANHRDRDVAAD